MSLTSQRLKEFPDKYRLYLFVELSILYPPTDLPTYVSILVYRYSPFYSYQKHFSDTIDSK